MPSGRYFAERIFDGSRWHDDAALVVEGGRVAAIRPQSEVGDGVALSGWIVPGFVDLQVNGGGGVLFNNDPSPEGIRTICAAHAGYGTTSMMVTLITDRPEVTACAIQAAEQADAVPGFLGLHLEGPHLALSRKGTHDPALIRRMEDEDLAMLILAAGTLRHMICTVAPEAVTLEQVADLTSSGAVVSLGHSDTDAATALAYAEAGARMVTHLFNAMSPLGHRAPGLVGAALSDGRIWCGLIADGFHVDGSVMRIALRGKCGPAGIFLVSDAMGTIGSDLTEFTLNGRRVLRNQGRLTLEDGTLAGADIALIDGVRYLVNALGMPLEDALRLASAHPAQAIGVTDRGNLLPGARADFFTLTPQITAEQVWIGGRPLAS